MSVPVHLRIGSGVNLADWRGTSRRRSLRNLIAITLVLCALVLVAVWALRWHWLQIAAQSRVRQQAVPAELRAMAPGLAEAAAVEQALQRWRSVPAWRQAAALEHSRILYLFRDLSAHAAEGVRLESVAIEGDAVQIAGTVSSKALALDFVRALKARGWPTTAPMVGSANGELRGFQLLIKPKVKAASKDKTA